MASQATLPKGHAKKTSCKLLLCVHTPEAKKIKKSYRTITAAGAVAGVENHSVYIVVQVGGGFVELIQFRTVPRGSERERQRRGGTGARDGIAAAGVGRDWRVPYPASATTLGGRRVGRARRTAGRRRDAAPPPRTPTTPD
ncbi:jg22651 [Pararge aegeria aegeria]|uniref:Jg22651 protein n=1 Tax=Pararge aegeria aegeria TaxID=348720 RepID=A0A8S4R975_9NEOP|nr:jg22651 [Pararge aegeria aegeria]